jgi:MurNAc alpha-1-phosphate uridylyltransferase
MYTVAILAGGMATRLYPVSNSVPKSMIEISGKPFIDWQLELLSKSGIKEVVLCLGNMALAIQDYVGDGTQYGISVEYSLDGKTPLGTGGAIVKALPLLGDEFGVIYGDSYLPIDYRSIMEFYSSQKISALMTIYNNGLLDKSNVVYRDRRIMKYSKLIHETEMSYIDYGFSIFKREVFSKLTTKKFLDLSEIFENLAKTGDLSGYEVNQRFYEVGSFRGIEEFNLYLEDRIK